MFRSITKDMEKQVQKKLSVVFLAKNKKGKTHFFMKRSDLSCTE